MVLGQGGRAYHVRTLDSRLLYRLWLQIHQDGGKIVASILKNGREWSNRTPGLATPPFRMISLQSVLDRGRFDTLYSLTSPDQISIYSMAQLSVRFCGSDWLCLSSCIQRHVGLRPLTTPSGN